MTIEEAKFQGWCECLDSVRASLRDYPNAGGDIEIMKEVERIAHERASRWRRLFEDRDSRLRWPDTTGQ